MKKLIHQSSKSFRVLDSSQDYFSLDKPSQDYFSLDKLKQITSEITEQFKNSENEVRISWCESEWSGKVEFIVSEYRMETEEEYQKRIEREQQINLDQLRQLLDIVNNLDYDATVKANEIISRRMMEFNNAS